MVLELLADAPDIAGGKVQPLPTDGTISALNIPHSSIVFDLHQVTEIRAELLGANGVATEKVKHANLVSFTCLKSFAFDQRFERKDAHDLIYCIEHAPEGMDVVAEAFRKARDGKHGAVIQASLEILRNRFTQDDVIEGYRKDGPVSVAKFELGEGDEPEQREARALRQRQASDVIDQLLKDIVGFFEKHGCSKAELSGLQIEGESGLKRHEIIDVLFAKLDARSDNGLGPFRAMLQSLFIHPI
jgi:hypothetical protein